MSLKLSVVGEIGAGAVSFFDAHRHRASTFRKIRVDFPLKRRDKRGCGSKKIVCSVQSPPPAWPGRAVLEPGCTSWDGAKPISIVGSTGSIGTQVHFYNAVYVSNPPNTSSSTSNIQE